jgi:hypothetical protein
MSVPKLSVVIPVLNEGENPYLLKNLHLFSGFKEIEVIISDGGSEDNTLQLCSNFQVKILKNKTPSRGERINIGIRESSSDMILLQHPRSFACKEGIKHLVKYSGELGWGGFLHSFDMEHPVLTFTSWYSNYIRGALRGILYLDHCIFLKRIMAMSVGGLPSVDIFEDTILSQNLFKKLYQKNQC